MKVCLVDYEYPTTSPNCGGGGRVTALLAGQLRSRGHQVMVITDHVDATAEPHVLGPSGGHWSTFAIRSYPYVRDAVQWADVVNGHFSLPSSLALPRLCDRYDTPLVVSVMGADIYDPSRFGWIRPAADKVNAYIFDHADAVVAPSMDMLERTQDQYDVGLDLIQYGIEPDRWTWTRREFAEPFHVVSVSRIIDRKNIPTAIEAVRELRRRGYIVEYTAIGAGDQLEPLRDKYGSLSWLSLPGYVDDLQTALDDAHLFLLPTVYEAFGIVYLEALASGLPVVTTDQGGAVDIVDGDVGVTTGPPNDPSAFADAAEQVIDTYTAYQAATKQYVSDTFAAADMAANYERLFHDLHNEQDTTQRVRASH